MIAVAGVLLAIASVFMFVVSMYCLVQWIDETWYQPRMRHGR
jgi:predicted RND superfamily exporter protein